jgi:tRNA (cytidine/uridine-2'-O-)-methyltransferase
MSADDREPGPPPEVERARLHVILFEPEIAANAGAIGRTCVAAGAALWMVRPLGFHLDDRHRRRAGLDYWPHLPLRLVDSLDVVIAHFGPERIWWFSTKADRLYTTARFREGDALVFGPESRGLPAGRLDEAARLGRALRIPIRPEARSLNLANAASVAVFEAIRQIDATGTDREQRSMSGPPWAGPTSQRAAVRSQSPSAEG